MVNLRNARKFCSEDVALIENYEMAMADGSQTWDCHHRLEANCTVKQLKELGLYFARPARELIFLTHGAHASANHYGRSCEEARQRTSRLHKGKTVSETTREKLRRANIGKHLSEECKRKIGAWSRGNKFALGHKHTEEWKKANGERMTKRNQGNSIARGRIWVNDGKRNFRVLPGDYRLTAPGFFKGCLTNRWQTPNCPGGACEYREAK